MARPPETGEKRPAQSVFRSERRQPGRYFIAVLTDVKRLLTWEPRPWTTETMATAMPAAIMAYSMAVAAESSAKKRKIVRIDAPILVVFQRPGILPGIARRKLGSTS